MPAHARAPGPRLLVFARCLLPLAAPPLGLTVPAAAGRGVCGGAGGAQEEGYGA